jgi:hypothetical protein
MTNARYNQPEILAYLLKILSPPLRSGYRQVALDVSVSSPTVREGSAAIHYKEVFGYGDAAPFRFILVFGVSYRCACIG